MTSLTGSAGEDFASILRALGYRMEKRLPLPPAPAPVAVEVAAVEAAAVEAVAAEAGAETALAETSVEASAAANDNEPAHVEAQPDPAASIDVEAAAPAPEQAEPPQEPAAVDATAADASDQAPAEAGIAAAPEIVAAPEMVEVWRPGGRPDERRPRHDRNRQRHQNKPQEGAQPIAAEAEAGEGAKRERHGRGRRDRNKDFRKPRTDAPVETPTAVVAADTASVREPREDKVRPPRERFQGKDRDKGRDRDKGKFAGKPKGDRDGRAGGGPSHRQYASSAPPRERERPIDPNSPFAKLAALKEQLTAGRKD
jgi:ATP-dependent RNA helicase SUPV3L1/SUV3